MNTRDLFSRNTSPQRLTESFKKIFGKDLTLSELSLMQLEDVRNQLRTDLSQVRSSSSFNESVENEEYLQTKMLLDAVNAELAERYNSNQHVTESKIMKSKRNLREAKLQQASAIVTAKSMVDRIDRWIEELSGMENETLLQLGDSIRDEIGQQEAKQFISSAAPAMAETLRELKSTREKLAASVRSLAGEETSDMLGTDTDAGADFGADNAGDDMGSDVTSFDDISNSDDDFGVSDAATGGMETSGRAQRESIDRSNRLLRVLAG